MEVERGRATYSMPAGAPLEIIHHGERATLAADRALVRPIPSAPSREPPSQPYGRAPAARGARDRDASGD